jgi:ABC-type Fe3+/spermidine/putrescine transport system ATPase subunit
VLGGLDLDVRAGTTLALLGASGTGKTTLLRIVAGLDDPDAGRVLLGDVVVADPRSRVPCERRGVGLVFQDLELWPHRTVAENVAFGLAGRPRGRAALADPRVRALAERLGFAAHLARRPDTLSGGERQRVALARTLAPDPDVVLYDEPLGSLDPARRQDLARLLRGLARERAATVLLVTHDPAEALALGDEIAVLDGGRVVDRGTADTLYDAPTSAAGARALGPVTLLSARLEGGAWETPLGRLEAARGSGASATHVVLRPERVAPAADGTEVRVVGAWPRGADWAFVGEVGGTSVEGRSATALEPGATVRVRVRGPVSGLAAGARAGEAA